MVSRSFFLGYHGCDYSTAQRIVSGRDELRPSNNKYDWLGGGIYFWEDSAHRALLWAKEEAKRNGRIKKPAVVGGVIDLGHCLNLIDSEHVNLVADAHHAYLAACKKAGVPPLENKGADLRARYLDKIVFETLHNIRTRRKQRAFDTIRAFFVEGKPLYDNTGLRSLDHIQICVRNPKQILGYFLPRH